MVLDANTEENLREVLARCGAQSCTYAYRVYGGKAVLNAGGVLGAFLKDGVVVEPTLDTQYDLASLTKLFTASAVLLLVEEGRLGLKQLVREFLPEFSRQDVSVEQLLSHTSMLDVYLSHVRAKNPTEDGIREAIYSAGKQDGDYFYQDPNMILLGWILEKVTGRGLDQYMQEAIFQPLQMRNTGFNPFGEAIPATRAAEDGALNTGIVHDDTARILGGVAGHAGLFSTAEDMLKFLGAWSGREEGLLQKATREDAFVSRYAASDGQFAQALGWKLHSPRHNVAPFLHGAYMHGGFTGTYCLRSKQLELVVLTDFVYPGERTQDERESWWGAMRECVQVFEKSIKSVS